MTVILNDFHEREAALDTSRSHHVESPAGSGKTLLLTKRFLKLLGEVNHPGEILALTFTEKAAGEMQNRILHYLGMARDNNIPENSLERELYALASQALSRHRSSHFLLRASTGLNIMTFHGFCNYLVQRAPLEGRIAPEYSIIDSNDQALLIDAAIQETIKNLFSLSESDIKRQALENRLLHHNNNWYTLSEELQNILRKRDQFADLIDFIHDTKPSALSSVLNERIQLLVERHLGALRTSFLASDLGSSWRVFIADLASHQAEAAVILPQSVPDAAWASLSSWQAIARQLLTQSGSPRKSFGPKTGFYSNFKNTAWAEMISIMNKKLVDLLSETIFYPLTSSPEKDIHNLQDFIILVAALIDRYETMCRQQSMLDFIGLEQAALSILNSSDPSDSHLYLDYRLKHLLVDEFQDTNRRQWEMIQQLCHGWQPHDGRTIFIVGDPKQSIYAFRNAEVKLFMEACKGIPLPGQGIHSVDTHQLSTNFRSTRTLIEWINNIFEETVMTNPDSDSDEVPFSPSVSAKQNNDKSSISLNIFADGDKNIAIEKEALWVAQKVKSLIAEKDQKDIAILLFTRNRITRYLQALKDQKIPVQVQEGLALSERPEIMHLLQITRLLAYPHDDIAWASLLRSPWSWFDLDTLYKTAAHESEPWMNKLRAMSSENSDISHLVKALDRAFTRVGRDSMGSIVKQLWNDLNGPFHTAALYGMGSIANCEYFFEILEDFEIGSPQETVERIEMFLPSCYEPVDPSTAGSPVQIMTIHRAKGLEFDTVILPFLDWCPLSGGSTQPPPYLLERLPGTDKLHLIAMSQDRRIREPSLIYNLLMKLQKNRRWGEAKRLFYVAVTRAKNNLYLSGVARLRNDQISAPNKSILTWVMDHERINGIPVNIATRNQSKALSVSINPCIKQTLMPSVEHTSFSYEPLTISPEIMLYQVNTPSSSNIDSPSASFSRIYSSPSWSPEFEAIKGTIIHRLLHTALQGFPLPPASNVARALAREGIPRKIALQISQDLLDEVMRTTHNPFITFFTDTSHPIIKFEWSIEDLKDTYTLRSGTIDLFMSDGKEFWICDFKTSQPHLEEPDTEFISRETTKFRPQLSDYRTMIAHLKSIDIESIHAGIFLTSLSLWKEIT